MFDKSKIVTHLTQSVENAIRCTDPDDKKLLLQFLYDNGFLMARADWPNTRPYVWIDSEGRVNCDETNSQSKVIEFLDVYEDDSAIESVQNCDFVQLFA